MTKRGRRPGLLANPDAFADSLDGRSQRWVANEAGMSVSHLSELLSGSKGATPELAERLAAVLKARPGTLFPQLVQFRTEVKVFTASGAEAA
jgi:transcriptional regulator with XRE-family HTH domain